MRTYEEMRTHEEILKTLSELPDDSEPMLVFGVAVGLFLEVMIDIRDELIDIAYNLEQIGQSIDIK